jgi:hypothetical protein
LSKFAWRYWRTLFLFAFFHSEFFFFLNEVQELEEIWEKSNCSDVRTNGQKNKQRKNLLTLNLTSKFYSSIGAVYKWRHAILDNFLTPSPSSRFLLLSPLYCCNKIIDPLPHWDSGVIYGRPLIKELTNSSSIFVSL